MTDSWGNLARVNQQVCAHLYRSEVLPEGESLLPVGMRRSYGDVCTNAGGVVVDTTRMSKFIGFDKESGTLTCESGTTLWEILKLIVPHGWFLPVTPGTSFATVGGAVANDVHGKNHHVVGSFGCFVRRFELRRSDGQVLQCDRNQNADYFAATIGGLGLTGLITWVELALKPVKNPDVHVESIEYGSYQEFLKLSESTEQTHEYHVSWVDCLARGARAGQGVFLRANHLDSKVEKVRKPQRSSKRVPAIVGKGVPLVNRFSLRAFNKLYLHRNKGVRNFDEVFEKYFYPLDALQDWNRIYGRKGFYQFQCVVPFTHKHAIVELLEIISVSGQGSFLSVLKTMGGISSPGMLAFSRPGVTLALDFPNLGTRTIALLHKLEGVVADAGGALYPAKDALMSGELFRASYPRYDEFTQYIDPAFSSDFWRRITR